MESGPHPLGVQGREPPEEKYFTQVMALFHGHRINSYGACKIKVWISTYGGGGGQGRGANTQQNLHQGLLNNELMLYVYTGCFSGPKQPRHSYLFNPVVVRARRD